MREERHQTKGVMAKDSRAEIVVAAQRNNTAYRLANMYTAWRGQHSWQKLLAVDQYPSCPFTSLALLVTVGTMLAACPPPPAHPFHTHGPGPHAPSACRW